MSTGEPKQAKEANNGRIMNALDRLKSAIYAIKKLGQEINGTEEPIAVETEEIEVQPSLADLINSLPGRLDKATESIHKHISEIRDMIL